MRKNTFRKERVEELFRHLSAEFLQRNSNASSLITVTRVSVSPDLRNATVYISVLPEEKEKDALDFAKRKRSELRAFIGPQFHAKALPFFDIEIDYGEKNRQRLDELEREDEK